MINQITWLTIALLIVSSSASILPALRDAEKCDQFIKNLTDSKIPPEERTLEANRTSAYSGHNLNDLGAYGTCKKLPTQLYNLITLSVDGVGGTIGFCGPSFCSAAELQNISDTTKQYLQNMTMKDLSGYRIDVVDPADYVIERGFSFYLTVVLFSIITILILMGTIAAGCKSPQKEVHAQLQTESDKKRSDLREALLVNNESATESVLNNFVNKQLKGSSIKPRRQSPFFKFVECFDLGENYRGLWKNEVLPGHDANLNSLSGIRAFAFGWVVYGHTFMLSASAKNYNYASFFTHTVWLLPVLGAYYAVDAFFYLSGFLTGFIMLNKLKKMKFGFASFGKIIVHRLIRLWPTYFVMLLFFWKLSVYMGEGPLWYQYVERAQMCSSQIWKNMFLIDNITTKEFKKYCYGWAWYLSTDFQVFLVAPLICWIYLQNKERSKNVIWILMTISIITSYVYSADSGVFYFLTAVKEGESTADYMTEYYINPLVRMSPYLLGLSVGFMFKEYKEGEKNFFSWIKIGRKRAPICALSGFLLIVFLVFYPQVLQNGYTWSNGFAMTWSTFGRPLFGLGLFLLTAPCLVGELKLLGRFLNCFYFNFISKISYSGYLVHLIFLQVYFVGSHQFLGLAQWNQTALSFSMFILTCAGAIVLYLFIEKPIANIESRILHGNRRKEPHPIKQKVGKKHKET